MHDSERSQSLRLFPRLEGNVRIKQRGPYTQIIGGL